MDAPARPFSVWMKRATDEYTGTHFLDRVTREYRGTHDLDAQKVISGVGRGFSLLRNARKWQHPEVGAGIESTVAARGHQWRLVMAYGGFEIFAKALMCHFKGSGPANVGHFVDRVTKKHSAVRNSKYPLPLIARVSAKVLADADALVRDGTTDASLWHGWLHGSDTVTTASNAVQLARVVRNLSAHGVLSPHLAIKLGAVDLCNALVTVLVKISNEVIDKNLLLIKS